MTTQRSSGRGFASMTPERLREVSAKGGRNVAPEDRGFSRRRDVARAAGHKGGRAKHGRPPLDEIQTPYEPPTLEQMLRTKL